LSSDEVEDVVAIAAGVGGLRAVAGGNAACWRVAGAIAALGAEAACGFADVAVLGAVLGAVFGTMLRAIGRGFGNGIFGLAAASLVHACDPMISASVVAMAVERKAAERAEQVTAFLFRRITKGQRP
jgi:hypothetical protein